MKVNKNSKTRRNDKCPCGSDKKYKKCCIDKVPTNTTMSKQDLIEIQLQLDGKKALERQRETQQGYGKPIISIQHKDYRFVVVGNSLMYSKEWKTFHDFLFEYIVKIFTPKWFQSESEKCSEDKNLIVKWGEELRSLKSSNKPNPEIIKSASMSNSIKCYLNLSYSLYLLAHNVELQSRMVSRLKNKAYDQLSGAYYEAIVFSTFILAGYEIKIENESDGASTHCEFYAKHSNSGNNYWVEAKNKQLNAELISIGTPLYKSLTKNTDEKRVIFININSEKHNDPEIWSKIVDEELKNKEETLKIQGKEPDSAYVIVTNFPISQNSLDFSHSALLGSFKIDKLQLGTNLELRELVELREQHSDIFYLLQCLKDFNNIPSTFDGALPELAFNGHSQDFVIGNKLTFDVNGEEIIGVLKMATVCESKQSIMCVLIKDDGSESIVEGPLTDIELIAYKNNPETFIGQSTNNRKIEDGDLLGFYDFVYNSYKNTSKEQLISLMNMTEENAQQYSQKDLAKEWAIRNTYGMLNLNKEQK
jgi:hypothetical protein